MQDFLRAWSERSRRDNPDVLLDQASLVWFAELNRSLRDTLDDRQFRERLRATTSQLARLADEIARTACAECPGLDISAITATHPAPGHREVLSMLFEAA